MRLQSIHQAMPNYQKTNFCGGQPEDFIRLFSKAIQEARNTMEAKNMGQTEAMFIAEGGMRTCIGEILEFPNALKSFLANANQYLQQKIPTRLAGNLTLPEMVTRLFKGKSPEEKSAVLGYLAKSFGQRVEKIQETTRNFTTGNYYGFIVNL